MIFNPLDHNTPEEDLQTLKRLAVSVEAVSAVEVGAWAGQSTLALLEVCYRVFSVDTWCGSGDRLADVAAEVGPDNAFTVWCRNIGGNLFSRAIPCRGTSLLFASVWPYPVDLVFLDADHRYEAVKADIAAWWPHVRTGGLLIGHDYHLGGVRQAVDEFGYDGIEGSVWWKAKKE